jgi:hypothetical protein
MVRGRVSSFILYVSCQSLISLKQKNTRLQIVLVQNYAVQMDVPLRVRETTYSTCLLEL